MPKPNTMDDDWIDGLLKGLEAHHRHYATQKWLSPEEAKALITAKLQEVDRAARLEELRNVDCGDDDDDEQLVQWAFDHMYSTMDGRSINGRIEHLEELDRLASLKGGDV